MESFAVWYESFNGKHVTPIECDIHVNFWMELGIRKRSDIPLIDFGIKVKDVSSLKKIKLFIPFNITLDDIEDLGTLLKNKPVLDAVFNESCTIVNHNINKQFEVKGSQASFNVYELAKDNDIKIFTKYKGTVIEINTYNINKNNSFKNGSNKDNSNKAYYFRLRIKSKLLSKIVRKYKPSNVLLQSAISYTQALNFRFNDIRTLDSSLLEKMDSEGNFNIGKLHFLLLTKADVDIVSQSYVSERELEKEIWDSYVGFKLESNIVAYHWKFGKTDVPIKDVILFIKMKLNKCNWATILIYIGVLALLTIIFNLISSCIFNLLVEPPTTPISNVP